MSYFAERCNELVTKFKYSDSKHYSKVVLEDVITRLRLNAEALTFGASLIQLSIQSATITEHLIKELEYRNDTNRYIIKNFNSVISVYINNINK